MLLPRPVTRLRALRLGRSRRAPTVRALARRCPPPSRSSSSRARTGRLGLAGSVLRSRIIGRGAVGRLGLASASSRAAASSDAARISGGRVARRRLFAEAAPSFSMRSRAPSSAAMISARRSAAASSASVRSARAASVASRAP